MWVGTQKQIQLWHQMRCTIERTFGVWKNRFEIIQKMRKYNYKTQVHLVCATMTIHNFIRRNSRKDIHFRAAEDGSPPNEDNGHEVQERSSANVTASSPEMNYLRDAIRDNIVKNL